MASAEGRTKKLAAISDLSAFRQHLIEQAPKAAPSCPQSIVWVRGAECRWRCAGSEHCCEVQQSAPRAETTAATNGA